MATEYMLDPSDRVIAVDEPWIAFAEANGAAALTHRVLGESLWRFIASPTLRELYRTLLSRVRATGSPVRLAFRCDSPSVRRFMMLSVGPGLGPRGTLAFSTTLLRQEPQPAAAQAFYSARSPDLSGTSGVRYADGNGGISHVLTMCSTCKRVDIDGWCEIDEAIERGADLLNEPVRPISHGLCPACRDVMLATMS